MIIPGLGDIPLQLTRHCESVKPAWGTVLHRYASKKNTNKLGVLNDLLSTNIRMIRMGGIMLLILNPNSPAWVQLDLHSMDC